MISISTAWNCTEKNNLRRALTEIKACGLNSIEIGYNFTVENLKVLIPLLNELRISVASIHNFCPLPEENEFGRFFTNYYLLSSLEERERKKAVFYTKQTIDTAKRIKAKVVVIHAGAVEMDANYTKELMKLFNDGAIISEKASNIRAAFCKERRERKKPHIDAVLQSLTDILEYALCMNIKIGLENRYYASEIPDSEEALFFLEQFSGKGLFYWHDVGHSCIQEYLMLIEKDGLLNKLGKYLIGFHLHDIHGLKDHLSPLSGDFNFSRISGYLCDKNILKVIEAHRPSKPEEIQAAINYFKEKNWF